MTQEYQIGDEVAIIATGERFRIDDIWENRNGLIQYSHTDTPHWYPASALRKIEELKVGDWVEIVGQPSGLFGHPTGHRARIDHFNADGRPHAGGWYYDASSLRKLAPSEILGQMDSRLEKIEAAQAQLLKSIEKVEAEKNELEEALQAHARDTGKRFQKIATDMKRIGAEFEKRLAFLESLSKENAELTDIGSIAAIASFGPIPACIAAAIHHESEEAEKRKLEGEKEDLEARRLFVLRRIAMDVQGICESEMLPDSSNHRERFWLAELEKVEKQLAERQ